MIGRDDIPVIEVMYHCCKMEEMFLHDDPAHTMQVTRHNIDHDESIYNEENIMTRNITYLEKCIG